MKCVSAAEYVTKNMHVVVDILDSEHVDDPCALNYTLVKDAFNRDVERAVPVKIISLVESLFVLLKKKFLALK